MLFCKVLMVLALVLHPKKPTEPKVTNVDGNGVHTVVNPFAFPVKVNLDCGMDWETMAVVVPAKQIIVVKVSDPDSRQFPICMVGSWEKAK